MPEESVDVITLIFVLSAVHPDKMKLLLENISRVRLLRCVIDVPDTLPFYKCPRQMQSCVCEGSERVPVAVWWLGLMFTARPGLTGCDMWL